MLHTIFSPQISVFVAGVYAFMQYAFLHMYAHTVEQNMRPSFLAVDDYSATEKYVLTLQRLVAKCTSSLCQH